MPARPYSWRPARDRRGRPVLRLGEGPADEAREELPAELDGSLSVLLSVLGLGLLFGGFGGEGYDDNI